MTPSKPEVSLCIATRGDPRVLDSLGSSLAVLRAPSAWEAIIAFNGRERPDPALVATLAARIPLIALHEPNPGKSRALNRAMAAARGDLIAFTDDDVEFEPDWLERLLDAAHSNPQANVFGGRILARGDVPAWIRRSSNLEHLMLSEHDHGADVRRYPAGAYPIGPNMAVRRAALEQWSAQWPEDRGPGTALPVGDETEFLAQLSPPDANDRLYVGTSVTYHKVDGRYFSPLAALRRSFQAGLAAGRILARFGMASDTRPARRALTRVVELRSFMELACIVTRAVGVVVARLRGDASR